MNDPSFSTKAHRKLAFPGDEMSIYDRCTSGSKGQKLLGKHFGAVVEGLVRLVLLMLLFAGRGGDGGGRLSYSRRIIHAFMKFDWGASNLYKCTRRPRCFYVVARMRSEESLSGYLNVSAFVTLGGYRLVSSLISGRLRHAFLLLETLRFEASPTRHLVSRVPRYEQGSRVQPHGNRRAEYNARVW